MDTQQVATSEREKSLWEAGFLEALAYFGNDLKACEVAGIERTTIWRKRKAHPDFDVDYREARERYKDRLEDECRRRGVEGWEEPVIHNGKLQFRHDAEGNLIRDEEGNAVPLTIRKFDTTLLIFVMKAERRDKFSDRVHVITEDALMAELTRLNAKMDENSLDAAYATGGTETGDDSGGAGQAPGAGASGEGI